MSRILTAALAMAALLAAVPAGAQPFRSDTKGSEVTGSGIARYPAIPTRDLEGALFREVGERTAFRSQAVADAMLNAAGEAQRAACSGTLVHPPRWPDSLRASEAGQRIVCGLLASADSAQVLRALRQGRPGTPGDAAGVLVAALAGLGSEQPGTFPGPRGRHFVDGTRWEAAVRAYDAFLDSAPDSLLADPPPELVAIGILLNQVVSAGLAAAGR